MTALDFESLGKEVLAGGLHYADAFDETAAAFIADACNALAAVRRSPKRGETREARA